MTRKEAAEKGEHIYQYKPCRQCGDTRRYTSGGACPTCLSKKARLYHAKIESTLKKAKAEKKLKKESENRE